MSYCAIQAKKKGICLLTVRDYQVDPVRQAADAFDDGNETAATPYLSAARLPETTIFEYMMQHWDERFVKNGDGDYPLHVVCCDPCVSLQAIKILVNRNATSLAMVDREHGLLPFHYAAN
jgi:hypothetical protein